MKDYCKYMILHKTLVIYITDKWNISLMHPHWEIRYWFTLPLFLHRVVLPQISSAVSRVLCPFFPSLLPLFFSSSSSTSSTSFLLSISFTASASYPYASFSPPSVSLLLTDWARYLLPAARAAKLKARTRVHFLRAAFYTMHYNARACTHYTVPRDSLPADPPGPAWENTETIIVRETYDARYGRASRARSRINANAQAAFMIAVRSYRSISSFGHSAAFGLRTSNVLVEYDDLQPLLNHTHFYGKQRILNDADKCTQL